MEGAGKWFDSADEARAYVHAHHARGARSFDVGCFQLNYRWHGQHFASIDEMFQPLANAHYAARFLSDLRAETGSWSGAAGAYHSRTPTYANRYRARFDRILAQIEGAPPPAPDPMALAAAGQTATGQTVAGQTAAGQTAAGQTAATPAASADAARPPRVNTFPLLRAAADEGPPAALGSLVPLRTGSRRFIGGSGGGALLQEPSDAG